MAKPNPDKFLPPDWEGKMAFVKKLWDNRKQEKWHKWHEDIERVSNILKDLVQNPPSPKLCSPPSRSCLRLGAQRFESFQPSNE